MTAEILIRDGQVLTGPLFSELMRVETVRSNGPGIWVAGLVGQRSKRFRRVMLTLDDISNLIIVDSALSYQRRRPTSPPASVLRLCAAALGQQHAPSRRS